MSVFVVHRNELPF